MYGNYLNFKATTVEPKDLGKRKYLGYSGTC